MGSDELRLQLGLGGTVRLIDGKGFLDIGEGGVIQVWSKGSLPGIEENLKLNGHIQAAETLEGQRVAVSITFPDLEFMP